MRIQIDIVYMYQSINFPSILIIVFRYLKLFYVILSNSKYKKNKTYYIIINELNKSKIDLSLYYFTFMIHREDVCDIQLMILKIMICYGLVLFFAILTFISTVICFLSFSSIILTLTSVYFNLSFLWFLLFYLGMNFLVVCHFFWLNFVILVFCVSFYLSF